MAISITYAQMGRTPSPQPDKSAHRENGVTRFFLRAALLALSFAAVLTGGCHKNSTGSLTVNIDPSTAQSLDAGKSLNFTAAVAGDLNSRGVTWQITLSGNICEGATAVNCGTLSNITTSSVTYTAPAGVSSSTSVSVTAEANADHVSKASTSINLVLPPQFTTTSIPASAMNGVPYSTTIVATNGVTPLTYKVNSGSLPAGLTLNPNSGVIVGTPTYTTGSGSCQVCNFSVQVTDFNGVTALTPLALSITVSPPTPLQASASLPQGFTGARYNGQISASGGVPPLLFGLTSGSLDGLTLSSTSGQISGIPQATGTFPFTVQVSDHAIPMQTVPVSGTITVTAPSALQITTNSLIGGTAGQGYSALVQATGGVPPYTWSVTSGQLPPGLSLATQSDNTGLISGTPSIAGTETFTVQVKDSELTPQAVSAALSITIVNGTSANNNSLLTGTYAFFFQGLDSNGPVTIAGTLSANGTGTITSGFEDVNRGSGIIEAARLSGTYSIGLNGSDGRGTLHLIATPIVQGPLAVDYQLVLDSEGNFRMIENNDTPSNSDSTGTHGTGILRPATQASFSASNFSGNYAFQLTGADYSGSRMAIGGILHANGNSSITPIIADQNDAGKFSSLQAASGTFSFDNTSQRGNASLLYEIAGVGQLQLDFTFYMASPSQAYFVETDVSSTTQQYPRLGGPAMLQQTGVTFGNTSLGGISIFTGTGLSGSNSSVLAGLLTAAQCDGSTLDASLSYDQNNGGTYSTVAPASTSCSVTPTGRVAFTSSDPRLATAYLTGPGQGFTLGSDAAVTTGVLELQSTGASGTFTDVSIQGSYELNSAPPGDNSTPSFVGQVSSTGTGSMSGTNTYDEVDAPGKPAHLGESIFLTINSFSAGCPSFAPINCGRGTITTSPPPGFPQTSVFYIVSPTQVRLIPQDSNPGNGHPEVIFLNH